ncbi:uncharacterized protein [Nicotiana sylvestris]|uniref:Uncharacterized protein LOC104234995 n=1 Tax=Nicotiana sylvestris TaxID=4096 RepID=A0A1U7XBH7_NICSY|nr:PREDICTED: uncharacterized protein LOC104234995 [Nicotiana sylvestris]
MARLFNEGHLREFLSGRTKNYFRERDAGKKSEPKEPQHVIHMISGKARNFSKVQLFDEGWSVDHPYHYVASPLHMIISRVDIPRGPIFKRTKVSITRGKWTRDYFPEDTLTFTKEDIEALSQPHNDALAISILLNKDQVKYVLVDPGSSTNIIRYRVVEQLGQLDRIIPASQFLNGFNMASETTKGESILPVNMDGTIQDTKFHVIESDMRYNALFGRPWIHSMRAVPSTLHQMMKFPTKDGVKTVYGEQDAAKEMFAVHESVPMSAPSMSEKPKDEHVTK